MCKVLRHTKVDIVFSLNLQQSVSALLAELVGSRLTVFHRLPVEKGCWWLPILRNGEGCLGAAGFRQNEFARVVSKVVKSRVKDITLDQLSTS
jgi:hypothetical protein